MTGTTTGGLVYPLSSEPVRDGATRMQYFLEQLDQDPVERTIAAIGSQTIPDAVWAPAAWASTEYDHGSGFATNTAGVQPTLAGRYWVEFSMLWPAAAGRFGIGIGLVSGSQPARRDTAFQFYSDPTEHQNKIGTTLTLPAGGAGAVTGWMFQQRGGAATVVDRTQFSLTIRRLRLGQAHS